jgi:hypothetical protein
MLYRSPLRSTIDSQVSLLHDVFDVARLDDSRHDPGDRSLVALECAAQGFSVDGPEDVRSIFHG